MELLSGKVARPLDIMLADGDEPEVDMDQARIEAVNNMERAADYDKVHFDS